MDASRKAGKMHQSKCTTSSFCYLLHLIFVVCIYDTGVYVLHDYSAAVLCTEYGFVAVLCTE